MNYSKLQFSIWMRFNPIFSIGLSLGLLFVGCTDKRYVQCQQIFQIAERLNQNINSTNYFSDRQPVEMQSWIEAARTIERAASHLDALHIDDGELIKYRKQFVTIYRIYSQTTYDAVKAREERNSLALQSARDDAQKAGQIQQNLIKEINEYCLDI